MAGPTALEGRNLNSLGFQPQVGRSPNPHPPWRGGTKLFLDWGLSLKGTAPSGRIWTGGGRYLGLKPQAIQIPPLQGEISRVSI